MARCVRVWRGVFSFSSSVLGLELFRQWNPQFVFFQALRFIHEGTRRDTKGHEGTRIDFLGDCRWAEWLTGRLWPIPAQEEGEDGDAWADAVRSVGKKVDSEGTCYGFHFLVGGFGRKAGMLYLKVVLCLGMSYCNMCGSLYMHQRAGAAGRPTGDR